MTRVAPPRASSVRAQLIMAEHADKGRADASGGAARAAPRSHTPESSDAEDAVPLSVRGAAPELRRIIRKRQNSESAKRCRERKKIESARALDEIVHQAAKVRRLEAVVQHLAQRLEDTHAMLAALTGRRVSSRSISPVAAAAAPPAMAQMCAHGTAGCAGAQCAMCVAAAQGLPAASVAYCGQTRPPAHSAWTHGVHATAAAVATAQTAPPVQQAGMAGGASKRRHAEDVAVLANKVEGIEARTWQ